MTFKYSFCTAAAAFVIGSSCLTTATASTLTFDNVGPVSGSVSYAGDGGALNGNGISFDQVTLEDGDAPSGNANSLSCNGCTLGFQTGDNINEGSGPGGVWTFDGGGQLAIDGTAQDGAGNTVANGTLLSGDFTRTGNSGGSAQTVVSTGPSSLAARTYGSDELASGLMDYFGIDADSSSFDLAGTTIANGAMPIFNDDGSFNTASLQSSELSIQVSQSANPGGTNENVPGPSELGVFGLGLLLVFGGIGARSRTRASQLQSHKSTAA